MVDRLANIHVVLVEPKNPGNIGSAVRAMKNMGLGRLRLVNPVAFRDETEQKKMGYRSQEIVAASREFPTLATALADISSVYLATARKGKWKRDFFTPRQAAVRIVEKSGNERVAVVFGREDKGVTIEESQLANCFIKIPSAVAYPSLNLAQAVMVVAYEIYQAQIAGGEPAVLPRMAERKAFARLADNIWSLMKGMKVREPDQGLFHRSLRRALNRTNWTNADIAVFDRFCKQIRWYQETHCSDPEKEADDA